MSLAEAFKDGREFRRLLSGGYEEDLRQQKELKQAQITESRQRTQASKDRIALAQKSEDRIRRNQLFMDLVKNKITPEIQSMKNRNASQEEFDSYSDKLLADYPDIMSVYGEKGIRFKKRNREVESDITATLTQDNLSQYYNQDDPAYSLFMDEIERGNGQMRATISVGEDGRTKIESLKRNYIEENLGNDILGDSKDVIDLFDAWHSIQNKEEVEDEKGNKISWIQSLKNEGKTKMEAFASFYNKMKRNSEESKVQNQSITKSDNDIQSKETRYKIGDTIAKRSGNYKYKGGDPELGSSWDKI